MAGIKEASEAEHQGWIDGSELLPLIYRRLRHMAAVRLVHEKPGQTLQPTELVHEAWLRLQKSNGKICTDERQFFAAAAEAMRRILIERARHKRRLKHGGDLFRVDFEEAKMPSPMRSEELMALDEALIDLTAAYPETAEVIKLRFFAGQTDQETARILGISRRTADRMWSFGRAWLARAIGTNRATALSNRI